MSLIYRLWIRLKDRIWIVRKCIKYEWIWINLNAFKCEFEFGMKISQFQSQILIYCVIGWDQWCMNEKYDEAKRM